MSETKEVAGLVERPADIPQAIWDKARDATGGWMVAGEHEVNHALVVSVASALAQEAEAIEEAIYGRHERGFVLRPLIDPPSLPDAVRALKEAKDREIERLTAERDAYAEKLVDEIFQKRDAEATVSTLTADCQMKDELLTAAVDDYNQALANVSTLTRQLEEAREALERVLAEKAPAYHDCTDDGLDPCAWCAVDAAIRSLKQGEREAPPTSNPNPYRGW